ncbi:MAG: GuaB3 family IMP dehydrogenase-related protein [Mycobacterium leprae]
MADVEIGLGRTGRRAFGFADVSIVPSRRTRDPEDVSIAWEIDAYRFRLPLLAAADSVVSPAMAVQIGRLGGLGVLNLEGLWARHPDPEALLEEVAALGPDEGRSRLRELYAAPLQEDLVTARVAEVRAGGVVTAAALTPQRTQRLHKAVLDAGAEILVIKGTVVSAEHVSTRTEPLNLKRFIGELDVPVVVGGCANYQTALHLMRTGAAGVLVGIGSGRDGRTPEVLGVGVPMATAVADAAAARRDYLDDSGGRYVHVIAAAGIRSGADVAKAIACGADAVMVGLPLAAATGMPGRGWHWEMDAVHETLPRAERVRVAPVGTLAEVLLGPARTGDGSMNLFGALRRALATTGYSNLKEFQRVEVVVTGPGA